MNWINENKDWIFSGIGGMLIGLIANILLKTGNNMLKYLKHSFLFVKKNILKKYSINEISELKEFINIYLAPNPITLNLYSGTPLLQIGLIIKNSSKLTITIKKGFMYIYLGQNYKIEYHHENLLKPNEELDIYPYLDLNSEQKQALENCIKNSTNYQKTLTTNSTHIEFNLSYKNLPFDKEKTYHSTISIIGNYIHNTP